MSRALPVMTLVYCLSASIVSAQTSGEGTIRGTVKDQQGGALPGVTISATSEVVAATRATVSDAQGRYRLTLPPGEYSLIAELQGFSRYTRDGIVVRAGLNIAVDIPMTLGQVQESVTVTTETPMLEVERPVQAVNVTGDFVREVPLSVRRDFTDFLRVTPGINTWAATAAGIGAFHLRGSNIESHVTLVDGADLTAFRQSRPDFLNVGSDAVADVQIKTAGSDASAPLGVGAVIVVATPTGTNDLHGTGRFTFTDKSWNADNNPDGDTNSFSQLQPEFGIGGPILRDRLWFYGTYRATRRQSGILRDDARLRIFEDLIPGFESFDNETDGYSYLAKFTAQLSPKHSLDGFYQYDSFTTETNRPETAGDFIISAFEGAGVNARLTSTWSPSLLTRLAISYNDKGQNPSLSSFDNHLGTGPARPVHTDSFVSTGRRVGTGTIVQLDNIERRSVLPASKLTISAALTYYTSGSAGSHEIRTGVHLQPRLLHRRDNIFSNDGFALEEVVLNDPSDSSAGTTPFHRRVYDVPSLTSADIEASDYAWYIQDSWKPADRLTVNAGVRIDWVNGTDRLVDVELQDSVDIGPRFGATYVLTDDYRNVLHGSWGRVHDLVSAVFLPTASSATPAFTDSYDLDLDGVFETSFVRPGSTSVRRDRTIDPDYHQPFIDEWTAGYRRQLPGQLSFDLTFVRRDYKDRPALVETNGIYDGGIFRGYQDESLNQIFHATNNEWNRFVYSALELLVTKRTRRLKLIGSYTRAWRHLGGTWQPNDPPSFIQPETFPNNKGLGTRGNVTNSYGADGFGNNGWTDHSGRIAGTFTAGGWSIASNLTVQYGSYSGPVVTRIAEPDPRFGPPTVQLTNGRVVSNPLATTLRFVGATRGDEQVKAPLHLNWDIHVGRAFHFGTVVIEPGLDIFNITNGDAYERFANTANRRFSPLFGQPDSIQAPRAAQITVLIRF